MRAVAPCCARRDRVELAVAEHLHLRAVALRTADGDRLRPADHFAPIVVERVQDVAGLGVLASARFLHIRRMPLTAVFRGHQHCDPVAVVVHPFRIARPAMARVAIQAFRRMLARLPLLDERRRPLLVTADAGPTLPGDCRLGGGARAGAAQRTNGAATAAHSAASATWRFIGPSLRSRATSNRASIDSNAAGAPASWIWGRARAGGRLRRQRRRAASSCGRATRCRPSTQCVAARRFAPEANRAILCLRSGTELARDTDSALRVPLTRPDRQEP